ncbi:hypothetical protein MMC21_002626 [Puttea exsequens]|nr:hypothetical protein [Puttea exsequens]
MYSHEHHSSPKRNFLAVPSSLDKSKNTVIETKNTIPGQAALKKARIKQCRSELEAACKTGDSDLVRSILLKVPMEERNNTVNAQCLENAMFNPEFKKLLGVILDLHPRANEQGVGFAGCYLSPMGLARHEKMTDVEDFLRERESEFAQEATATNLTNLDGRGGINGPAGRHFIMIHWARC